jgi:hypothetical protein
MPPISSSFSVPLRRFPGGFGNGRYGRYLLFFHKGHNIDLQVWPCRPFSDLWRVGIAHLGCNQNQFAEIPSWDPDLLYHQLYHRCGYSRFQFRLFGYDDWLGLCLQHS